MAIGEVLWDILPDKTVLGGAPFNFAYRVNSLGDKAVFVSRLGKDERGRTAFEKVQELQVDTRFIQWDDRYPTGTVTITFDENKKAHIVINPGVAYDHIEMNDQLIAAARTADCICFGTLVQRAPVTRQTVEDLLAAAGSKKLLDINLRIDCYSPETVTSSLKAADLLKLNDEEVAGLVTMLGMQDRSIPGFCAEIMEQWSLECCLVTLGSKGVYARVASGEHVYAPGYKVSLVDALGSGDAFTAGFIHNYLEGTPLTEACSLGNIMGAICATQTGATQPITPADIEHFKKNEPERVYDQELQELL